MHRVEIRTWEKQTLPPNWGEITVHAPKDEDE